MGSRVRAATAAVGAALIAIYVAACVPVVGGVPVMGATPLRAIPSVAPGEPVVCMDALLTGTLAADPNDLQARYDRLVGLTLRMGGWLTGPDARRLPDDAWEAAFSRYREHLEQLRRMGEVLRPISLRDRSEPLAGDALVGEVLEMFAA